MYIRKIALTGAISLALIPATAQRDTTRSPLDEVIVTATKFSRKSSETGKVVSVITRQMLERNGGKDLSQLLNEQTGIVVNGSYSNPGKDKTIFLRGAKYDYVLILIDGVPVYDPSGISSNFDPRMIPIDMIERIEILKGSQSTLYGSDAVAGVINIISRKGGEKKVNGFTTLGFGTYNSFRGNTGVSGKNEHFDYNISYAYNSSKGISEAKDKDAIGNYDKDGYHQHSVLANLGIRVLSNWKISPYLRYNDYDGELDLDAFIDDKDYSFRNKNIQGGMRNELRLGSATLMINYNYNHLKRSYLDDSTDVPPTAYNKFLRSSYTGEEHFAEAALTAPLGEKFSVVAGADFRSSNTTQNSFSLDTWGSPASESFFDKDSAKQDQFNLFASLLYKGKIFQAEAGTRYNHHSLYGSKTTYNFNPFVLINNEVKIFANISSAFKIPSLYQLYSQPYGNKGLKPEYATTYEGGVQYFDPNQRFNIRAVVYKRNIDDVIVFLSGPGGSKYQNQDKQRDLGIEIEPTINLSEGAQLILSYAYVDGKVTTKNAAGKDTSYFNLLRRPRDTWGMTLNYTASPKLFFSSGIRAFGKRLDIYYDPYTYASSSVQLPSYTLWNLYGEYRFCKAFRIFAEVRNLTGTDYTEVYGYTTQGTAVTGGLTFRF